MTKTIPKIEKIPLKTKNLTEENIEKLSKLFPELITEVERSGKMIKTVDLEELKELIGDYADEEEVYKLNWVGKRESKKKLAEPITETLRPVIKDSVEFDKTKNVFIEGDNFEVLKLLKESYLNSIKMIYIDPPYNTGKDFVYKDNFAVSQEEYNEETKAVDKEGNKLFKNTSTNGRFHSDWLSMIYERLRIARDILKDDGVIFISIDDNEFANLRKICDEVLGEENFISTFVWKSRTSLQYSEPLISSQTEYILLYGKNKDYLLNKEPFNSIKRTTDGINYYNPDKDVNGDWTSSGLIRDDGRKKYTIVTPSGKKYTEAWLYSEENMSKFRKEGLLWFGKNGDAIPRKKSYWKDYEGKVSSNLLFDEFLLKENKEGDIKKDKIFDIGTTESGTKDIKELFNVERTYFDYPKPVTLIKYLINLLTPKDITILDFFAGSATTAHAVMQLNAEDGGNRKFIMVQLPEETDKESEAYKAGYKNICEIAKERIRRAAKKIKEENKGKNLSNVDFGFKVFKTDSSNMKDVYYNPKAVNQRTLGNFKDNIKEDRASEDLLYQVLLDWAIPISSKVRVEKINNKKVFIVETESGENWLAACFDEGINQELIKGIIEFKPSKIVFKDSSFKNDSDKVNCEELLKHKLPNTEMKVI